MIDLEDRLAGLSVPASTEPDGTTVAADVARGRAALRQVRTRRARRVGVGALVAAGVTAGALVLVDTHRDDRPPSVLPSPSPRTPRDVTPSPLPDPGDLGLVAYQGRQTPGFHVDYVPKGFVLQGADNVSLAVARRGDRTGIFDFRHKIVVTVETVATHGPLDPGLEQVIVGGRPGTIETRSDGTTVLYVRLDDERLAFVQAWRDVGLSHDGLLRFAEGLRIADDVETVS